MKKYFASMVICVAVIGCGSTDEEKLQGQWNMYEAWGEFAFGLQPFLKDDQEILAFEGKTFTFENNKASKKRVTGTFSVDTTKSPNQITFQFGDDSIVAIYSVSGSHLQLCVGEDDASPPARFKGGPDSRPALIKFNRVRS